jgi:pimeloyl-ACP methyl ester carboxylesterase
VSRRASSPLAGRRRLRPPAPIRPGTDLVLRLHDGRRLGVAEFGSRSPLPVVYCHGFLGSRLEPGAAKTHGINILAFDRPGYGRTDPQRLPSLRGWGADVAEALAQLGVAQCLVVGVSSGAPYALAVAAALGGRARRVILASGIGGPEVLETGGGIALALSMMGRRDSRTGRLLHRLLKVALAAPLDRPVLALALEGERGALARQGVSLDELHARLLQAFRAGNNRGLRGPLASARLVAQPWDFAVGEILTDVEILHGAGDSVVPPTHAHWYAAHLPRARLELIPGEHHLSMCLRSVGRVEEAVRELAPEEGVQRFRAGTRLGEGMAL